MSLHSLPFELLRYICTFLASIPDLKSLSLVNQKCHSAAASVLFRSVTLQTESQDEAFEQKITALSSVLRSVGVQHVREMEIQHYQLCYLEEIDHDSISLCGSDGDLQTHRGPQIVWNRFLGEDLSGTERITPPQGIEMRRSSLVQLIEELPALQDFIWCLPARMPSSIINALRPECRVHLRTNYFGEHLAAASQYARKLAPTLSSVCVQLMPAAGEEARQIRKIVRMFLGVVGWNSITLREIRSCSHYPPRLNATGRQARDLEWAREDPSESRTKPLCKLVRLDISGQTKSLPKWTEFIDLASLRTFHILHPMDGALQWLTLQQLFTELRNLILGLRTNAPPDYNTLNEFLASLLPLQAIRLEGNYNPSNVSKSIQLHGPSLRKLWLLPCTSHDSFAFSLEQVKILRQHCPQLEDLRFTIRRSQGDSTEVSIYKLLGSFPSLRTIFLTLDCSSPFLLLPRSTDQAGEEEEEEDQTAYPDSNTYLPGATAHYPLTNRPTKEHIRSSLINGAIDSSLAKSIYTAISRAKSPNSAHLRHLVIHPIHGGKFAGLCTLPGLPACFSVLQRSWKVSRRHGGSKGDAKGDVEVEELGKKELGEWRKDMKLRRDLRNVFEELWPLGGKDGDWRRVWRSFPLREGKDREEEKKAEDEKQSPRSGFDDD